MDGKNEHELGEQLKYFLEKEEHSLLTVLSENQKNECVLYLQEMLRANELYNLTAITDPHDVILYHLVDSLIIPLFVDMTSIRGIVDIGTGAGFPGIPLKICYPDIPVVLIEVNQKKIKFLERIISLLSLKNITIYKEDWRTFLRKTHFDVDLFLSRASLQPDELIRMFKGSSFYQKATCVYFASEKWKPLAKESRYLYDQKEYTIKDKTRILAFFRACNEHVSLNQKDRS